METKTPLFQLNVLSVAKKLAVVTILGFGCLQAHAAVRPTNLKAGQAQAIVNQVYERAADAGALNEPKFLSQKLSKALNHYGFATKSVHLARAQNAGPLKLRGADGAMDEHQVTIVRLLGGWRVVDPVVLQSARLEPFSIWRRRISSPVEMSVR